MLVTCKFCSVDFDKTPSQCKKTKNNFCSRSCAASYNNKISQKRKPTIRICTNCATEYTNSSNPDNKHRSLKFCRECSKTNDEKIIYSKSLTIGDYQEKLSILGKHVSWKNSHIRLFNRSWNKNLTFLPCQVCNYSNHVELAHIKSVTSFPLETTLGTINDPSNILVLCPNHHWEFDNNKLLISQIPPRHNNLALPAGFEPA